jgi:hypothetical protein
MYITMKTTIGANHGILIEDLWGEVGRETM